LEAIENHIKKHIGKIETVMHELASALVHIYALLPIYKEEMEFKLKRGGEKLYERFDQEGINELLDINRKNVCHKRFGIF